MAVSLYKKLDNATHAAFRAGKAVAAGEVLFVETSERVRRKSICSQCEYAVNGKQVCAQCGCFLALKTTLSTETCTEGKW